MARKRTEKDQNLTKGATQNDQDPRRRIILRSTERKVEDYQALDGARFVQKRREAGEKHTTTKAPH